MSTEERTHSWLQFADNEYSHRGEIHKTAIKTSGVESIFISRWLLLVSLLVTTTDMEITTTNMEIAWIISKVCQRKLS